VTVPVDPIGIALLVTRVLETIGVAHTIGGSIASSFAGEPRSTADIDIVAALTDTDVPALVAALADDFYIDDRVSCGEPSATGRVQISSTTRRTEGRPVRRRRHAPGCAAVGASSGGRGERRHDSRASA
jgi:hypothetical protein